MSAIPPQGVSGVQAGSDQWIRRCQLIVGKGDGTGLDLSNMRIKFNITAADATNFRPKDATITVYNLSDATLAKILEFTQVILQAGYEPPGHFGVIFSGTIRAFTRGHESVTESFLTIYAGDGDAAIFAVTNTTLKPGHTAADQIAAHTKALESVGISPGAPFNGVAGGFGGLSAAQATRGVLMTGQSTVGLDSLGKTYGFTWTIHNGQVQIVPLTGYLPGVAVVLNAKTGLIGWPSNTPAGIEITCLLNPAIRLQGLVQINNKDINTTLPAQGSGLPSTANPNGFFGFPDTLHQQFFATVADDGYYRVLVIEFEGDTRGNAWFCHLICLAADLSAPVGQQVPDISTIAGSI